MSGQCSSARTAVHRSFWEAKLESEKEQSEKGDCLQQAPKEGLPELVFCDWRQNDVSELRRIWDQWEMDKRKEFRNRFGDVDLLLKIQIDTPLMEAIVPFWDPSYRCFSFNGQDLTPTIEEYSTLLRIKESEKIYWKEQNKSGFRKRINKIVGPEVRKGEGLVIPWNALKSHIVSTEDQELAFDLFGLAIYGLIVFSKTLGHIEATVVDFFGQLKIGINPAPTILAETVRSLNHCRKTGKGRFIGCVPLLYIWMRSHLWGPLKRSDFSYSSNRVPI